MCGQAGHNTRPHTRLPITFFGMDAWVTSQLNVALMCKLRESLAYFLTCYPWVFVQPGIGRCPVDWCRELNVYIVGYTLSGPVKLSWF